MGWTVVSLVVASLAVFAAAVILYGKLRWQSATRELRKRLKVARKPIRPAVFHARELDGLPAPVQRYFRAVLREGQPMIAAAVADHVGTFNIGETGNSWKRFTSTQWVVAQRPGFVWDGRVKMFPGVRVHVHDAYVRGEGILHPALLGLVTLADMRGTSEVAQGELMRFIAEAVWYPTAMLPSQGFRWTAVDDRSARGTLTDGAITLTLLFRFDTAGLIETVHAEARGRLVAGKVIPTPWEGRWSNYGLRDGMTVPLSGEVAWLLPDGPKPYWRGDIHALKYEFAT